MKQKIKNWYNCGVWTKQMVKNAVLKGKITAEDYEEITGEDYPQLTSTGEELSIQA